MTRKKRDARQYREAELARKKLDVIVPKHLSLLVSRKLWGHLEALRATGLYGFSIDDVALRMIERGIISTPEVLRGDG